MTIQQHASFDSSAAELNATSKLVKAWESKNAKNAAKAGGISLMALSLAACGGSSETVDLTPFDQADIDAAVNTVTVDLTAVNDNLTTANVQLTTANGELTTINVDLAADLDDAEDAVALLQAAIDEIDADDLEALEALAALGVDGTLELDEVLAAVAALNDDASFESGAASRDDEVTGLNDTITAIDNTDAASEQEAFDDGAASRDDEVANLQAQIDALLDADAALAARTLDADNETFAAGDATDFDIIVSGTTADADALTATVTGSGTGTLSFTFADLDDVVTLTATDLSSYSSIVVTAGTVDLTAVTLGAGVDITINSGVVMTAAQFLAADFVTTSGDGTLEIIVSSAAEAEAVVAASAKITGVTAANLTLTNAEGSSATDAEIAAQEAIADTAVTIAAASVDPIGSVVAAVDLVEEENVLVEAANDALADALAAADLAEAQATLDAASNELVDAELDLADPALAAAIADAIADTDTTAVQDIVAVGVAIDNAVDAAILTATVALVDVVDTITIADDLVADSPALLAAKLSDARDAADLVVSDAEDTLATDTEALNAAHGLAIGRYDSFLITQAATTAAGEAEEDAAAATEEAVLVAGAIIALDVADATIAAVEADGLIVNVTVDADGAGEDADAVNLFDVDDEGVASLNTDNVTVDAADASSYVIGTGDGVTVTASFIDDVLAAFQSELDAQAAEADAVEAEASALVLLGAAVGEAAEATEVEVLGVAELEAYITAVGALDAANTAHDGLETAIANYETVTGIDAGIAALELAATAAFDAAAAGADTTERDAAIAAVENELDDLVAPGLNFNFDDGVGNGNDYVYAEELVALGLDPTDLADDVVLDTTGGLDIIDFGAGTVFVEAPADANVATDAVGDANVIEVILQQLSDADDLPAGVNVYIETAAADGSSSTTAAANFVLNTEDGLSLADLGSTVDGLLITGAYDTGLIA